MLSYQHGYHAGNFADVIKHSALTRLLAYLTRKETPLFYLETHAGRGGYDLRSGQAEKTSEYQQGIGLVWPQRKQFDAVFNEYFTAISQLNTQDTLRYYPGSPSLVIRALRAEDRIYLCELHPAEFEALRQLPRFNKKVHCDNSEGIARMIALVPPPEKRGLIFIDPSFERKEEYKEIPLAIKNAVKKFSHGVYCLWYPVVNRWLSDQLLRGMKAVMRPALHIEFNLDGASKPGMTGCGLWIINPPYTLAEELKIIMDTLKQHFNPGVSVYTMEHHA